MRGVTLTLLLYLTPISTHAGIDVTQTGTNSAILNWASGPVYYTKCQESCVFLYFRKNVGQFDIACGRVGYPNSVGCPSNEELRMTCDSPSDAVAKWNRFFGGREYTGVQRLGSNWHGQMNCPASDGVGVYYNNELGGGEVPTPKCSVGHVDLTLSGQIGDILSTVQGVSVQCDSVTNIRLTIDGGGRVDLPGGGGVVLTFLENGTDVLTTKSDNTSIRISAALAKPPAGAGTYRGSAVLRLDIL